LSPVVARSHRATRKIGVMMSRGRAGTVHTAPRAMVAVGVVALLAACGPLPSPSNPAPCTVKVNDPHESTTQVGTISATVEVRCGAAPEKHILNIWLERSPVGANDWAIVEVNGIGVRTFRHGKTASFTEDLHDPPIPCPGGPFDYRAGAQGGYSFDPNAAPDEYDMAQRPVFSNVRRISC
jgi:hypothetical protein